MNSTSLNATHPPVRPPGAVVPCPPQPGAHPSRHRDRAPSPRCSGLTLIELIVVLTILVALSSIVIPLFGQQAREASGDATQATLARVAQAIVGTGGYAEAMRYARNAADTQSIGYGAGLPWPSPAEVTAGREDHPQIHYLFERPTDLRDYDPDTPIQVYDPVSKIGWRGPWLDVTTATAYPAAADEMVNGETASANGFDATYGVAGDLAPLDGWGNPVVIQLPEAATGTLEQRRQAVRLISAGPNGTIETPADVLEPDTSDPGVVGDDVVLFLQRENP